MQNRGSYKRISFAAQPLAAGAGESLGQRARSRAAACARAPGMVLFESPQLANRWEFFNAVKGKNVQLEQADTTVLFVYPFRDS